MGSSWTYSPARALLTCHFLPFLWQSILRGSYTACHIVVISDATAGATLTSGEVHQFTKSEKVVVCCSAVAVTVTVTIEVTG
jgi:hypothetical protein